MSERHPHHGVSCAPWGYALFERPMIYRPTAALVERIQTAWVCLHCKERWYSYRTPGSRESHLRRVEFGEHWRAGS